MLKPKMKKFQILWPFSWRILKMFKLFGWNFFNMEFLPGGRDKRKKKSLVKAKMKKFQMRWLKLKMFKHFGWNFFNMVFLPEGKDKICNSKLKLLTIKSKLILIPKLQFPFR